METRWNYSHRKGGLNGVMISLEVEETVMEFGSQLTKPVLLFGPLLQGQLDTLLRSSGKLGRNGSSLYTYLFVHVCCMMNGDGICTSQLI